MEDYLVDKWYGLLSRPKDDGVPKGYASNMLNWVVLDDRIELRRGMELMGVEVVGLGEITGLKVGKKINGDEVLVRTRDRKIEYYDTDNDLWVESLDFNGKGDIINIEADGNEMSIEEYHSMAGAFLYISSPNASVFKLPIASPSKIIDLAIKNHRGHINIKKGATFLFYRKDTNGGSDTTGLYRSVIDRDELSDYAFVSAEVIGVGDGATKNFTGSLDNANGFKSCMYVNIIGELDVAKSVTNVSLGREAKITSASHGVIVGDHVLFESIGGMVELNGAIGRVTEIVNVNEFKADVNTTGFSSYTSGGTITKVEKFTDDRSGNLVGNQGGEGTINYGNGDFDITFNTAPLNAVDITVDYYTEDSTNDGIFDFSKSLPRLAGEGFVLRQDDGGGSFKNMGSIGGDEYCFHEKNIYKVTIAIDDDSASNLIYRNNSGVQNRKAIVETEDGIYFIDSSNKADPYIRLLQPGFNNPNAIPKSISDNIDLSGHDFDDGGIKEWGPYIVVWGKKIGDAVNDRMFFYHKLYRTWIITDYRASIIDSFNGELVAGDSGSDNVLKLFSGITDEEANIENFYETGDDDMGKKKTRLGTERFHRFVASGLIQRSQAYDVYFSYDNAKYVKVGTVDGSADYVDQGTRISVGNNTLGSQAVGSGEILASPYTASIKVHTPKFQNLKIKYVATGIGYVSIHDYECKDRRQKGRRVPPKYIQ